MKIVIKKKKESSFSACVCWRTNNQSLFCRYVCCHEQGCCFSADATLRVMVLFILRDKECLFVSAGVLNRLVLKPFAPAFFPARGTAL